MAGGRSNLALPICWWPASGEFRKLSTQNFWILNCSAGLAACSALWLMLPLWDLPNLAGAIPVCPSHQWAMALIVFLSVRSTPIGILRAQDRLAAMLLAMPSFHRCAFRPWPVSDDPSMTGFLIVWGCPNYQLLCYVVDGVGCAERDRFTRLRKRSALCSCAAKRKEFLAVLRSPISLSDQRLSATGW